MYVDSLYTATKVESRYKGITAIKLVGLKNFFGDKISMTVYQTEFEVIGTFGETYKTNVLVLKEGQKYADFEGAIAAKVYTFLEELNLIDSNVQDLKKENPEAFMHLCEKCRTWVFETFDIPFSDEMRNNQFDYTFNNFFELLTEMCLISAHAMLAGNDDCDYYAYYESKRRFELISDRNQNGLNLFDDVKKMVKIPVKPEKIKHSIRTVNMYKKTKNIYQKATNLFFVTKR